MKTTRAFLLLLLLSVPGFAATGWEPVPVAQSAVPKIHPLPTLREQAVEQQAYLDDRGERHWTLTLLPWAEKESPGRGVIR